MLISFIFKLEIANRILTMKLYTRTIDILRDGLPGNLFNLKFIHT